jgi:hypothetical protein
LCIRPRPRYKWSIEVRWRWQRMLHQQITPLSQPSHTSGCPKHGTGGLDSRPGGFYDFPTCLVKIPREIFLGPLPTTEHFSPAHSYPSSPLLWTITPQHVRCMLMAALQIDSNLPSLSLLCYSAATSIEYIVYLDQSGCKVGGSYEAATVP